MSLAIFDFHNVPVRIYGAVVQTFHLAYHLHIQAVPDQRFHFYGGFAVVVAGGDYDAHVGATVTQGEEGVHVELPCLHGGHHAVEHVAAYDQCIGAFPFRNGDQLVEKRAMFMRAVVLVQHVPEVPVRGM